MCHRGVFVVVEWLSRGPRFVPIAEGDGAGRKGGGNERRRTEKNRSTHADRYDWGGRAANPLHKQYGRHARDGETHSVGIFPGNDRDQRAQGVHLGERAKRLTVHNVSDDDGIVRLHAS